MEHQYQRGWQRYNFDLLPLEEHQAHGAANSICGALAFHRGLNKPHVTFSIIPPDTGGLGIGLHIHRNPVTGKDAEVWYIILEGHGIMTFTNGDEIACSAGDLIVTYPGTGHAFRAVDESVKVIAICPEMYTPPEHEEELPFPERFTPQIQILDCDRGTMCVRHAVCTQCGAEWTRPIDDPEAATLPPWARAHRHEELP